ncbi:bromodomain-containing protein 3-like isoform X5 [Dinothrombium tinctorium]|uniref:Bromodomain-containing protein 3-like isoform X5 n=1 Tax=Dinothrombium tinctorium TaxID=1965070 RepID=A0A443QTS7_9ACAR|nr:bromodomain-containing protein 3-like isoform X5 [Dinothrombium tinctorium]
MQNNGEENEQSGTNIDSKPSVDSSNSSISIGEPTAIPTSQTSVIIQNMSNDGKAEGGQASSSSSITETEESQPALDAQQENNAKPMTYGEKFQLCRNVTKLPGRELAEVVHIVRRRESWIDKESDLIEIDFLILSESTLRELESLVKRYQSNVNKS